MGLTFLYLPTELIITILSDLDAWTVKQVKLVNRFLHSLVGGSLELQYLFALDSAGYIDGPTAAKLSTSERLKRLQAHQRAWRTLTWRQSNEYEITNRSTTYELYGGVYAHGLDDPTRRLRVTRGLELIEFPSLLRNMPEGHRWRIPDLGLDVKDFGMDPDKNLLILIQRPPAQNAGEPNHNPSLAVHLMTLREEDAKPHPLARQPVLYYEPPKWHRGYSYWIQVVGDVLAVLFSPHKEDVWQPLLIAPLVDELVIWKWKTGQKIASIKFDGASVQSFSFLSNSVVMVPVSLSGKVPVLQIYELSGDAGGASLVALYSMPPLQSNVVGCHTQCRADPSPWVPPPRRPMHKTSEDEDLDEVVWPHHGTAPFAPHPRNRIVVLSFWMVVAIYGVRPDGQIEGMRFETRHYTAFVKAETLLDTYKPFREKLVDPQTDHVEVPWALWGPDNTRILTENTNANCVCYVYGMRYARLVSWKPGEIYLRLMDFNDVEFEAARRADAKATRSVAEGDGQSSSVKRRGSKSQEENALPGAYPMDSEDEYPPTEPDHFSDEDIEVEVVVEGEDEDGEGEWVDEEGDEDVEDAEAGEDDEEEDDENSIAAGDAGTEDEDERRTATRLHGIDGFGGLNVAPRTARAACKRTTIAFHPSYIVDRHVFKKKLETRLPFRWTLKESPEIQEFSRVMIDDEHIIGVKEQANRDQTIHVLTV